MFKVGFGYDVHQLAAGREFWLGGIQIPHSKGTVAHSDGDVLIHAICDAILGALNLGDIGMHFPDSSDEFKNIDSKILLKRTVDLLLKNKYSLVNIDSTVCLQKPKISDYIPKMKKVLSETISISSDLVSIKATTTEKLGFIGREEGIAAYAVVLVEKN
jgi:2-C-methyl-D-erythritol 2,4-cyclodiphosphate synthase